jgi:hypothetical protein
LKADVVPRVLVFLSPALELPDELKRLAAHFSPGLSDRAAILRLLRQEADDRLGRNGERLRGEQSALEALVQHLVGLTEAEARRLIRLAIRDDGLLTAADVGKVLKAKHDFLGVGDVLALETAVSGMAETADWRISSAGWSRAAGSSSRAAPAARCPRPRASYCWACRAPARASPPRRWPAPGNCRCSAWISARSTTSSTARPSATCARC